MKTGIRSIIIIFLVILADQAFKIWIKTHMFIGQEFHIAGNWFIIHYTENNGMAFGLELAGGYGKLALSLFRIVAVCGIGWVLVHIIKHKYHSLLIICVSLIFAGALGNIIDSTFYGVFFGYESLLHGRVVDMLYFPLIEGHYPSWSPVWAGQEFIFFRPVFNLADSAISIGVIIIFLFQKQLFANNQGQENTQNITSE